MVSGCTGKPGRNAVLVDRMPKIDPDYSGIIIPPNIAPINFSISEQGTSYCAELHLPGDPGFRIISNNGVISIPPRKWKKLLESGKGEELLADVYVRDKNGTWNKYSTIKNQIASEPVDPYISYRLLYPGYESWSELSIQQRSLADFRERTIVENSVADENCVNCHSFNNGKTDDFLFHMRGNLGGTYFSSAGGMKKTNLKTPEMKNGSVYPRWHPSGKYVAFSSNKIVQRFHSSDKKKIEVSDLESSLVLYSVEENEIMQIPLQGMEISMDTYPEWSPDGKYLYFCRAKQIEEEYDYQEIRYNLWRISFNQETLRFGEAEMVFNAEESGKSISFPRISPDGRFALVTMSDYGCFPIWHMEADLYIIDLNTFESKRLELNSDFTDSYHSWSTNGRWIVFSSRRIDGLTTRLYISYFDAAGKSGKPFLLPQKDPDFYNRFLKSYNVPEFSVQKIDMSPSKMRKASGEEAVQAKWSEIR